MVILGIPIFCKISLFFWKILPECIFNYCILFILYFIVNIKQNKINKITIYSLNTVYT